MRDQEGAGFQGDTRDQEGSWNYQRSEWRGNFRGTHEVKELVGSHETSRVYDCGCARPEAPFGVTEDTKGRIYRRHSSSRGSGSRETEGMRLQCGRFRDPGGGCLRTVEGTEDQGVRQDPKGCWGHTAMDGVPYQGL